MEKETFEQKLKLLKTLTNGSLRDIGGDRTINDDPWGISWAKDTRAPKAPKPPDGKWFCGLEYKMQGEGDEARE